KGIAVRYHSPRRARSFSKACTDFCGNSGQLWGDLLSRPWSAIGRSSDSQVCAPPSSNGWTGQRSILIFDSDLIEVKATKQKPPHVGEVPLTREFETTITAIETKNDRSLES